MKKFLVLLLALSMLLCLGACGEKFSDNDKNDKIEKQEDDEKVKIEEIDVEEIEKKDDKQNPKKKIIVGYTIYEPMNYKDKNGELVGFDTELAQEVFSNLGYEVEFKEIEWSQKYIELDSGAIDCVWNGFTANAIDDDGIPRSDKVDFSYYYIDNTQAVVVRTDSDISTYTDIYSKTGVAELGSAGESYATYIYEANCNTVVGPEECLIEVRCGAADFAVVDFAFAKKNVGFGDYSDLKVVPSLTSESEYYAIGFKKGSDLTAKINEQLEELAADGTIDKIAEKYELEYSVITDFSDQR